ncbi:hypothetical protein HAX54_031469 [Datura stramonium]|uniref:Uncharacterized protein n=1 Tax=Datura stramonium TaxID=4076 RepID=A0ABS8VCU7_DATST|nr:hypothetical protein [Datura stramonium]
MGPTSEPQRALPLISSLQSNLTKPSFLTRGSNPLVRTLVRLGRFSSSFYFFFFHFPVCSYTHLLYFVSLKSFRTKSDRVL